MQDIIILLIGFLLLIKGADYFVDSASNIALIFNIPAIIVGLTIVAIGTSAPELSVSLQASMQGSNDIALSNIIGSNLFNTLACLGCCALLGKVLIPRTILRRDIPFFLAISLLLIFFMYNDFSVTRVEGIILLVILIGYITLMIIDAKKGNAQGTQPIQNGILHSIFFGTLGLLGIFFGGEFVVSSAKSIALTLGLSETLVGLTIVSIGTSLPELVTSVVATKKGDQDIAIGNVIGSNIFNILLILGSASAISSIAVDYKLFIDTILMIGSGILVLMMCKDKILSKNNGIILVVLFISYMTYIVIRN